MMKIDTVEEESTPLCAFLFYWVLSFLVCWGSPLFMLGGQGCHRYLGQMVCVFGNLVALAVQFEIV